MVGGRRALTGEESPQERERNTSLRNRFADLIEASWRNVVRHGGQHASNLRKAATHVDRSLRTRNLGPCFRLGRACPGFGRGNVPGFVGRHPDSTKSGREGLRPGVHRAFDRPFPQQILRFSPCSGVSLPDTFCPVPGKICRKLMTKTGKNARGYWDSCMARISRKVRLAAPPNRLSTRIEEGRMPQSLTRNRSQMICGPAFCWCSA